MPGQRHLGAQSRGAHAGEIQYSGLFCAGTIPAGREGLELAEQSIRRAAVQCYALEGFYPAGVDYLEEYYGVSVDEDRYFVDYRYIASNLMPDITVLPTG